MVEVAGSERHDKVAEADKRRVSVGEQTDDDVVAEYGHRRLLARLQRQYIISHRSPCTANPRAAVAASLQCKINY